MSWHLFSMHVKEKPYVDDFIKTVNSAYDDLNKQKEPYFIYEGIEGNEISIYLNTEDLEIYRLFIDHFINGLSVAEPKDLKSLTLRTDKL